MGVSCDGFNARRWQWPSSRSWEVTSQPHAEADAQSLNLGAVHGSLNDVAVFGPRLAWAVGTQPKGHGVASLVERWDGQTWSHVAVPPEPGHDAGFGSIAGSSAHDVWALGSYQKGPFFVSYADHWDGAVWTKVPLPQALSSPTGTIVQGLSVVSPTDAWASGFGNVGHPWIVHWDGKHWRRVPCPNFSGRWATNVWDIVAFSAANAWITGEVGERDGSDQTLAAHWDGSAWRRVATPNPGRVSVTPWRMDASSPDNIYAAGFAFSGQSGRQRPFLMHYDGSMWRLVKLPPTGPLSEFSSVSTASADDAWAVGDGPHGALAMHWDGSSWTVESPGSPAQSLVGIDDVSSTFAIAVGSYANGSALHEVWDGTGWSS